LLEGLVYGAVAGRGASKAALEDPTITLSALPIRYDANRIDTQDIDLADIRNSVRSLMWRHVGVHRKKERLQEAIEQLIRYSSYVLAHRPNGIEGWELQNMLTVGLMMTQAALSRRESRGVHLRLDYPKLDNEHWRKHLAMRNS
jgi:L-aspartate oxidase